MKKTIRRTLVILLTASMMITSVNTGMVVSAAESENVELEESAAESETVGLEESAAESENVELEESAAEPEDVTKYTVTFETDGGSAVELQTVNDGEKASRPAENPTKEGYTFADWYEDEELTTVFDFENMVITKNITIYAKWEKIHVHAGVLTEEKKATCMESGYNWHYRCECGEMFSDKDCTIPVGEDIIYPMLEGHEAFRSDWKMDGTDHWKTCTKCGEVGKAAHDGTPCSVCGYDPERLKLQGSGTAEDPYLIGTADDLTNLVEMFHYGTDKCFKLTDNIDFGFAEWTPIEAFSGVFDGNEKKISNIAYKSAMSCIPLLDSASGSAPRAALILYNQGTVKNLTIENVRYNAYYKKDDGAATASQFAGFVCHNQGTISGCTFDGSVTVTSDGESVNPAGSGICQLSEGGDIISCTNKVSGVAGGIVGVLCGGTVRDCKNTGNVRGPAGIVGAVQIAANGDKDAYVSTISGCENTGKIEDGCGICGSVSNQSTVKTSECIIENCINTGDIKGQAGILGTDDARTKTTVKNCKNTGEITNGYLYSAGIVGSLETGTVTGCINEGAIGNGTNAAGIAGYCRGGSIESCYNTGDINCLSDGGIVCILSSGAIKKCYNSGSIYGTLYAGGIAGNVSGGEVSDCFNTGTITEKENSRVTDTLYLGGLFGAVQTSNDKDQLTISRCYNIGSLKSEFLDSVKRERYFGAIVGKVGQHSDGSVTFSACCYGNRSLPAFGMNGSDSAAAVPEDGACKACSPTDMTAQTTFAGWDFDTVWRMGEGDYKYPVLRSIATEPVPPKEEADTLTAYDHKVTFDSRTGAAPKIISVFSGAKLKRPEEPTRKGYTFTGWYTEDSCVNLWDFERETVWDDITLYAGWEAEEDLDNLPETDDIASGNADNFWIAKVGTFTYTGAAVKPSVRVYSATRKLRAGIDYTVTYSNNVKAGTATVRVKGKGVYKKCGVLTASFTILPRDISGYLVNKNYTNAYAVGKNNKNPALVFTAKCGKKILKKNVDYTLKVFDKDGTNEVSSWNTPGTYKMKVEGQGNFTGTYTGPFDVVDGTPVAKLSVAKIPAQKYTGEAIKPTPTIKCGKNVLVEGTDYQLSYRSNTEIGTASLLIIGKGSYFGIRRINFAINGIQMKKVRYGGFVDSMEYTGKRLEQNATLTVQGVSLEKDKDYCIVGYINNKNAGTATVIYKGIGKYTGTVKKTFTIKAKSLKSLNVDTDVKLGGSLAAGRMPVVTIYDAPNERYLTAGTDYTVTYPNTNKSIVGSTVNITITGKGNYKDTIIKSYTITAE